MAAPDSFEIDEKVRAFIRVEALEASPGWSRMQERLIRDSGLEDEPPDIIFSMKTTFAEWRTWKSKQKQK